MTPELSLAGSVAEEDERGSRSTRGGCAGWLRDVFHVPDALGAPGDAVGEVVLPARAHDGAAIMTAILSHVGRDVQLTASHAVDVDVIGRAVVGVCSSAGIAHAAGLEGIGQVLIEREPNRQFGIEIVVDEFEGEAVLLAQGEFSQDVGM